MSLKIKSFALAAVAVVGLAASAQAASVTVDFGGGNSGTSGSPNERTFTNGGVTVKATGWSLANTDGATTPVQGWLGHYDHGLGVTNSGDGSHTVDNSGRYDYVQFKFSDGSGATNVTVTSVTLRTFSSDRDFSFSFGAWPAATKSYNFDNTSSSTTYVEPILAGDRQSSSTFNLFASLTMAGVTDKFKIRAITFDYTPHTPPVVPLPNAAVMGLGLLGGLGAFSVWRRRRQADLLSS